MVPAVLKILALAITGLLFRSGLADAAPIELKAKVVWVRGDRVYVASAESLAVEEGDVLRFRVGSKEIAAGAVVDVRDEAMIVATLTSGSLRKQKKLEKVRVLAERPPLTRLPMLRVGCPSPSRPSLLFACERGTIGGSLPSGLYRADTLSQRSYRFVRDSTVALVAPWPDTLLIRAFDESADEEIALERGELDVAVFWPGELSTHVRDDARWRAFPYGVRSRGSLWGTARDATDAFDTIDALNRAIFRGDLAMWEGSELRSAQSPSTAVRIEVDRALPGFTDIVRGLGQGARSDSAKGPSVRIFFQDGPRMVVNWGNIVDQSHPDATFLSAIRCPVVSDPSMRRMIRALDPNAFADLLGCGTPTR